MGGRNSVPYICGSCCCRERAVVPVAPASRRLSPGRQAIEGLSAFRAREDALLDGRRDGGATFLARRLDRLLNARMTAVGHRSRATYSRQPRQVRKEATVTSSCVCSGPPVPDLLLLPLLSVHLVHTSSRQKLTLDIRCPVSQNNGSIFHLVVS